jgi:serine protease Do
MKHKTYKGASAIKTLFIILLAFIGISSIFFIVAYTSLSLDYPMSKFTKHAVKEQSVSEKIFGNNEGEVIKVVDEQSQVIEVVKKASPAVVSIIASAEVPTFESYFGDPFFDSFFGFPSQGQYETERRRVGAGTGFVVSQDGYIITNKHVVEDEEADYTVYLNTDGSQGEKVSAQVIALHPENDLAVLKIERTGLPYLTFGDSDTLQVGQTAITIGYALGEFDNTVSKGVISGLSRSIVAGGFGVRSEELFNLIQTDAAINPGNSGGPMLDLGGNVVGINVAMASAENIGFAIPANEAKQAFEEARTSGTIQKEKKAFLGVRYIIIDDEMKEKNNLPYDYGVLIVPGETRSDIAVVPGSPADKAGLVENDIILEVDGQKITTKQSLASLIAKYKPGDRVTLKISHRGEERDIGVVFEEN